MRPKEVRRCARREAERQGIPITPQLPIYPSEVSAVTFTSTQQVKVDQILNRAIDRARKPYLTWCMLMKRALEFGRREIALTEKLAALINLTEPQP